MGWRQPITAISVGFLTAISFNSLGWLQISERQLYDFYLRSRPVESQDESIVIVGINEEDTEKLGIPLEDRVLATLLTKIKRQNPSVIGLDLHRNINIGRAKYEQLEGIFRSTSNLIGVEKTDGGNPHQPTIPPPIELKKFKRTGASEIIEDGNNGIVRRGYLYVQNSDEEEAIPSLGLAVALKYLEQKQIFPVGSQGKNWLQLDGVVFPKIEFNHLFYRDIAIDNYQILINYRSSPKKFLQVSASEILEDKISPDLFEGRIVLLGATSEIAKDVYLTPHTDNARQVDFTYGVEIHAELTSQIINAVLNNRKNLKIPTLFYQYAYLGLLSSIVSWGLWYFFTKINYSNKSLLLYIASSIVYLIVVLLTGYLFLLSGWWMATATALLICLSNEIVIYFFLIVEVLEAIIQQKTDQLESAYQKIIVQEKLALYQKTAQNIAHEIKNKANSVSLSLENSQGDLEPIKMFIDNNLFLFEELESGENSNVILDSIHNLTERLSRMKMLMEKITTIINNIYQAPGERADTELTENINQRSEQAPSLYGGVISDCSELNVNELLDEIIFELLEDNRANILIIKNYQEPINIINCVATEIERALENIIANAVYQVRNKAIECEDYRPTIEITTSNKLDGVEIKIRDNGSGIPRENLNKIFEAFWSTKSLGDGMGLGLYLAKNLIEAGGGDLTVSSVEGVYAEFTITLP